MLSLTPEALTAWRALQTAIAGPLGLRLYELLTLAAARGLGSSACLLAHGRKALKFMTEEKLIRLARNHHAADLFASEMVMMGLAFRLSADASTMNNDDSQSLRDAGFSDAEIVDVALTAAARNYFSKTLQVLAVDVDVPPGLSQELQDALLKPLGFVRSSFGLTPGRC